MIEWKGKKNDGQLGDEERDREIVYIAHKKVYWISNEYKFFMWLPNDLYLTDFRLACALIFLYRSYFLKTGQAIRCYECNSHTDVGCAEKVPPSEFEKDCSTAKNGVKYTFCRKITQIIEFSVNNCKY